MFNIDGLGNVKIKFLKVNFKIDKIKSDQIINKICLFCLNQHHLNSFYNKILKVFKKAHCFFQFKKDK